MIGKGSLSFYTREARVVRIDGCLLEEFTHVALILRSPGDVTVALTGMIKIKIAHKLRRKIGIGDGDEVHFSAASPVSVDWKHR